LAENVILSSVTDRVATLTLNRPDKLNALDAETLAQCVRTLEAWSEDPNVAVVVLTGAGRAFCAGGEIGGMAKANTAPRPLEEQIDTLRRLQRFSHLLHTMPKVTLASVNGFAFGAGLGICLACDLRMASDKAAFGTAYAKVGFGGDFGTTWLLTHYVGAAKAKELLFFAESFDVGVAERLGLLNWVVPHDALAATTTSTASRLAEGPLVSYRYMKANVNQATTADFRTMLDREAETHLRCGQTEDQNEGVRAFLAKRAPKFQG